MTTPIHTHRASFDCGTRGGHPEAPARRAATGRTGGAR